MLRYGRRLACLTVLVLSLAACGGESVRRQNAEVELYFRQLPQDSAKRLETELEIPDAPMLEWYGADGRLYFSRNDHADWETWEADLRRFLHARDAAPLTGSATARRDYAQLLSRGGEEPWLQSDDAFPVIYLYLPSACDDCRARFGQTAQFLKEQYSGRIVLVLLRAIPS